MGSIFLQKLFRYGEAVDKQGRIHGTTVVEGLAGAVLQKPLAIQLPMEGRRDRETGGWREGQTDTAR